MDWTVSPLRLNPFTRAGSTRVISVTPLTSHLIFRCSYLSISSPLLVLVLVQAQAAGMVTNIDLLPPLALAGRPAGSPTPRSTSGKSPQTLAGTSVGAHYAASAGSSAAASAGHHHMGMGRGVALSGGTPSALGLGTLDELPPAFGVGVRHLPQNLLDAATMAFSSFAASALSSPTGAGGGGSVGSSTASSGRASGRPSDATPTAVMSPLPSPHAPLPQPLQLPSNAALGAGAATATGSAASFNAGAGGAGPGSLPVDASLPQPSHVCSCETRIVELEPVLGLEDDAGGDTGSSSSSSSSSAAGMKTGSSGANSSSSPTKSAAGSPAKDKDGADCDGAGSPDSSSGSSSAAASGVAPHSAERGGGLRRRRAGSVSAVLTLTGAPPVGQGRPAAVAPGCCRFCGGRVAASSSAAGSVGAAGSAAGGADAAGARAGVSGSVSFAEAVAGDARARPGQLHGRMQRQGGPVPYALAQGYQGYQGYPSGYGHQQGPLLLAIPRATFGAGDFLGRHIHWLVRPASESDMGDQGQGEVEDGDGAAGDDEAGNAAGGEGQDHGAARDSGATVAAAAEAAPGRKMSGAASSTE